ncbi:CPBP family intramembrane glutamic endopeptidase [Anoxybacteroides amylolyticum]|uniref:CAAX protease self-immunity family protein n=1 Tax=Anoxybacteroides amylolyticum TaxID=294699 RepID=A0A160F852_9BACL|nr:CPBP family intramembrane glutamic endopeptidase [Anoxybacillus amylolyticus]ANB62325.1 CAAX protease self-immunity family protein [Anoxybacillus amylolyticus]
MWLIAVVVSILSLFLFLKFRDRAYKQENDKLVLPSKQVAIEWAIVAVKRLTTIDVSDWDTYAAFWHDRETINRLHHLGMLDEVRILVHRWGLLESWRVRFVKNDTTILVGIAPNGEIIHLQVEGQLRNDDVHKFESSNLLAVLNIDNPHGFWSEARLIGEGQVEGISDREKERTFWYLIQSPKVRLRVSVTIYQGIVWQVHMEPEIFAPTLSQVVQREFLDKVLNLSGVLGSFIASVIGLLIITIEGGKLNWNFGGVLAAIILFAVVLVTNDGFEFSMINSYDVRVNKRAIRMLTLVMSLFQAIATMCVVLISTSVGLFLTEQIGISAFEHPVNQIIVGVTAGIACLGGMTWLNAMLQSTGKVRIAPELSDYTMFVSGYNWKGALSMSLQSSIGEEAIYRLMGIPVIVWLTHKPWLAVLVTSLLWAIIHTGTGTHPRIIRWSEIVALGFVMGELYLQYGFIAALVAHFIHNFILMLAPIALTKSKMNRKALPINNAVTKG